MIKVACRDTGSYHRLFDRTKRDEPRHSIGTICPKCGTNLNTHSESFEPATVEDIKRVASRLAPPLLAYGGGQ